MNRDIFMDAVGYLDADILAEHLRQKEKLRSKLKSKRIIHVWRWSAIAACICLVVALGAVLIPDWSDAPDPIITDTKLESGFVLPGAGCGAPLPQFFCAYKSETNEFDIDNVTLEFYYGGLFSKDINHEHENASNCPEFDIYFTDADGTKYFVKHVEENFVSEKYRCELTADENNCITSITFNYSETITVPKELFDRQYGEIYFQIYSTNINDIYPEQKNIAGIVLFYEKIEDGKVILFSQQDYELSKNDGGSSNSQPY